MAIFKSYVSLPEGIIQNPKKKWQKSDSECWNVKCPESECSTVFFSPWIETHIGRIGIQLNVPIEKKITFRDSAIKMEL